VNGRREEIGEGRHTLLTALSFGASGNGGERIPTVGGLAGADILMTLLRPQCRSFNSMVFTFERGSGGLIEGSFINLTDVSRGGTALSSSSSLSSENSGVRETKRHR
jgi:hypothetical protein